MVDNIDKAIGVIERHNVSFNNASSNALYRDTEAFDLCSFYMAQVGEKVKLLTDQTKTEISNIVDVGILKYFRNLIDHDYDSVNKQVLQGYIRVLTSKELRNALINRIRYCQTHSK